MRLGDVHPAQEVRVARAVGAGPRESLPAHPLVDAADVLDRRLGVLDRSEGRRREEVGGALEAPPRVAAVAAVPGDSRHGERVERLEQQGGHPAGEHRGVGVHAPHRVLGVNQRSPERPQMTLARSAASSPATRARRAAPSRRCDIRASVVTGRIGAPLGNGRPSNVGASPGTGLSKGDLPHITGPGRCGHSGSGTATSGCPLLLTSAAAPPDRVEGSELGWAACRTPA